MKCHICPALLTETCYNKPLFSKLCKCILTSCDWSKKVEKMVLRVLLSLFLEIKYVALLGLLKQFLRKNFEENDADLGNLGMWQ